MSQTNKGISGCKVQSSKMIIGSLRIRSDHDLSASSIATRTAGRGLLLRTSFCNMDFNTGTLIHKKNARKIDIKDKTHSLAKASTLVGNQNRV